jgi:hypothetical protein
MGSAFGRAANDLDEETFQALYGRWDPLQPGQVAGLFAGSAVRWWVVGGRAARIGAPPRPHEDTDVAVSRSDLDELRKALSGWHLWEANDATLQPGIALLYKARLDRPKDRADLAAAALDADARGWLAATLDRLGHHAWANLARGSEAAG